MTAKRSRTLLRRRRLSVEALEERIALSATVVDHRDLAVVPALPQSAMDLVGQQAWFFSHASVGGNMTNGMRDLNVLDPARYRLTTTSVGYNSAELRANTPPASTIPGKIYDCNRGNPGWESKFNIFQNSIAAAGWHDPKVGVVMDKLCYIDQAASASAYLESMSTLEAAYPNTRFVYTTMPLTTSADSANVLRNQYNDAVRSYCVANGRVLFDLADIEAHDPEGNPQTFQSSGHTYQKLYSGYTTDGGHLNDAGNIGRQRAALGWYATAALVAGMLGTPTDLALSGATVAEHLPSGATVGTLTTVDRDAGAFTYTLVAGQGSDDNSLFRVVGDQLQTNGPLDFEARSSCSVRIRTIDSAGLQCEKAFSISVTSAARDMPGLYVPGSSAFYLRGEQSGGDADQMFAYGVSGAGWTELVGDWNGDGIDTPGMYDAATATFYLTNRFEGGDAEHVFCFGLAGQGWKPLVGDWDGDGRDSIAVYEPATSIFFFKNTLATGNADEAVQFGMGSLGWFPIIGDWDGVPGDGFGFYEPAVSAFWLKNAHTPGPAEECFQFGMGNLGWTPLAGNWDGTPGDGVGFYVPETGQWFLKNEHAAGSAEVAFSYGIGGAGWRPLVGCWGTDGAVVGYRLPVVEQREQDSAPTTAGRPFLAAADRLKVAALAAQQLPPIVDGGDKDLLFGSSAGRRSGVAVRR